MMQTACRDRILLYKNRGHAMAAEVSAANSNDAFGVHFAIPADIFLELWELWGDGRRPVTTQERMLIVYGLLETNGFLKTASTAKHIAEFIAQNVSFLKSSDYSNASASGCVEPLYCLINEYMHLLNEKGLVEPAAVFDDIVPYIKYENIAFGETFMLERPWDIFLRDVSLSESDDAAVSVEMQIPNNLDFIVLSGESARIPASIRCLQESFSKPEINKCAWVTASPMSALDAIRSSAVFEDVRVEISANLNFTDTVFGKFIFAVAKLLFPSVQAIDLETAISDISINPYSSISSFSLSVLYPYKDFEEKSAATKNLLCAEDIDTAIRHDRLLSIENMIACLHEVSKPFDALSNLLVKNIHLSDEIIGSLKKTVYKSFSGIDAKSEEAAIDYFLGTIQVASSLDISLADAINSAISGTFRVAAVSDIFVRTSGDSNTTPRLCVTDYGSVCNLAPNSFDVVVIDDISTDSFSPSEDWGFLDRLACTLGAKRSDSAVHKTRTAFIDALSLSSVKAAFIYSLRNAAFEESYPSFPFEELVDMFFDDGIKGFLAMSHKGLDCVDKLGYSISTKFITESDICAGIGWKTEAPVTEFDIPQVDRGKIDGSVASDVCTRVDGPQGILPRLSASSIELYMRCPYRWFIERRIGLPSLDENFGPIERGNFAHAVFERFYSSILQRPEETRSIACMDDSDIHLCFEAAFDEVLNEQATLEPGQGRYVACMQQEQIELAIFKERLLSTLLRQKEIPSEFKIYENEEVISFDKECDFVPLYAGSYIRGMIDRIDISSEDPVFSVLDYKGSNVDHQAGLSEFAFLSEFDLHLQDAVLDISELKTNEDLCENSDTLDVQMDIYPEYIQTLIYAQLQKRKFDFEGIHRSPVGALYIGYAQLSPKHLLEGSVSSSTSLASLAGSDSQVPGDFCDFLDNVEEVVKYHVDGLASGEIPTSPHSALSCRWCPVKWCKDRL